MKKSIFFLMPALLLWQCKSEPTDLPAPGPQPTKLELLTKSNWKLSAATIDPAYDYFGQQRRITNIYGYLSPCTLDDIHRYEASGVYTISDGPQVCSGLTGVGSFHWAFNADQTTLTQLYSPLFADETYLIEMLNADKLILTRKKIYSGDTYTLRFEYTKL